jgi:hypothetical protein
VWRTTRLGARIGAVALLAGLQGGDTACGGPCVESATIALPEASNALPCTVTVKGQAQTAIYDFPVWPGKDVSCTVRQGPTPATCLRSRNALYDDLPPDGSSGTSEEFLVYYSQPTSCSCDSNTAQSYFGGNSLLVTLTCGTTQVDEQSYAFECAQED